MAQENLTQNTATDATKAAQAAQQFSFGGMDQVSCGPAGLLYTLSNQLIMVYNELQDLYAKVAIAETNVQQSTIVASAAAQRQNAHYQAVTIGLQAGEAFAGAAVSGATSIFTNKANSALDADMKSLENELKPLKTLDGMDKKPVDPAASRTFGQGVQGGFNEVTPRRSDLLDRHYRYRRPDGAPARTAEAELKQLDQHAINSMSVDEYRQYKNRLGDDIATKEKHLNSLQSERLNTSQTYSQYGQIFSQGANIAFKGAEASTTASAGQEQATTQVANGVQQMASSTADSARGSVGQYYAKESDVIAAARQGANANAQL